MPNGKPVLPGKTGKTGKKRKWHSLIDKVYALPNLRRAWEKVRANGGAAGADGMTLRVFGRNAETLEHRLNSLSEDLRNKTYRPQPVRRRVRSAIVGRTGSGWWNVQLPNGLLFSLGLTRLDRLHAEYRAGRLTTPARKGRPGGEPYAGNPHVRFG